MLEKPDLPDEKIIVCLRQAYGLDVRQIDFLPLGADLNTAVYRAETGHDTPYFVKLRRGDFNEASVTVPKFLSHLGIRQIISPLPTRTGQLWVSLAPYKVILYPFIEGRNGFEVDLSDQQRIEFGAALKRFHTAVIPAVITNGVPRERFSPRWRQAVKDFLARIENEAFDEPVAGALAAFLKAKREETLDLVRRAERLASALRAQPPEFILCHGDIHGWNLLVGGHGNLYLVDWDTLIFAPKERDLMFVGSGLGGNGHTRQQEEALFYQGYGPTRVNPIAIAYYRYERIVEDIAVICAQIFLSDEGGADRRQALEMLKSNFLPGNTIAIAYQSQ